MPDDVTGAEPTPEPGDLTARLRRLEERVSAEIPVARSAPPVKRAAPRKARAVKAPAVEPPAEPPVKAPRKTPVDVPAERAVPVAVVSEVAGPSRPVPVAPPPAPQPAPPAAGRSGDPVVRVLLVLTVLLLAAAAGLASAAVVQNRQATYTAEVVVQLDPGNDPQAPIDPALSTGIARYVDFANRHAFTTTAAARASVPDADVRADISAAQVRPRQLGLTAQVATAAEASALATGAGDALVELVNLDQTGNVANPGDRLSAQVVAPATSPEKTSPQDRDAWIAGVLAAGAVLLLAGVATLLRVTRRS